MTEVVWFRRDLRTRDHPALARAAEHGPVAAVFVLDPALIGRAGAARLAWMRTSLRDLHRQLDGRLHVLHGPPTVEVAAFASQVGAQRVHVSADYGPYGRHRDEQVAAELAAAGGELVATGSPYAVAPGRIHKPDGTPYRVFTPFYKAWLRHGWRPPIDSASNVVWEVPDAVRRHLLNEDMLDLVARPAATEGGSIGPAQPADICRTLPGPPGEAAATKRWLQFAQGALTDYAGGRDRPDLDGTSTLSTHLRWGEIHPRTLLAGLGPGPGAEAFRRELAFREFYADVLHHHPASSTRSMNSAFDSDTLYRSGAEAEADLSRWQAGQTGYPFVDAGMRQLLEEGWMHNRVRMVVASFLVKDLLVPWWRGAEWFLRLLSDADLASNTAGWQWVAGCGTDAAPYFRVFNPVTQGRKFDPHGDYVRRYVPELSEISGPAVHEPWLLAEPPTDYPERIVDHRAAREEALSRYATLRRRGGPTTTGTSRH